MKKIIKLVLAVIICEGVGLISVPFTVSAIPTWYFGLNKPFFSPPNWIFSPVWTVLYFMMGTAAFLVWEKGYKKQKVREAIYFFGIQLGLNFVWSFLFFGLRSPVLGLIEIVLLWLAIFVTIKKFFLLSKPAAYLMIPYLIWVSFASLLNGAILFLNP